MTFGVFNLQEFISAFIILFAVIDAIGATPIIISLRESGKTVKAMKAIKKAECQRIDAFQL